MNKVVLFDTWHDAVVVFCCGYACVYMVFVFVMFLVVVAIPIIVTMVGVSDVKDLQKLWTPKQLLGLIELGRSR